VTADDLPLPTLLSRLLIAFTIEFDNEAEHRLEHRTTRGAAGGAGRGPWLMSQAMWANFMQFVGADGVPLHEVDDLVGITNLAGLQRWGYVKVGPDLADGRRAPPRRDWIVRPTRAGRRAQEMWEPLAGIIEDRWRARFGGPAITAMRDALLAPDTQAGAGLPRYLPLVKHEMFADVARLRPRPWLAQGLQPYPGGWRARGPYLRRTTAVLNDPGAALPHYPMVMHRGGWPDGS
jgi:hypothetical protein